MKKSGAPRRHFSSNVGITALLSTQLAYAEVEINNKAVSALLDSGAYVNVIAWSSLRELCGFDPQLKPTSLPCASVASQSLDVMGTIKLKIRISDFTWYVDFVVVSSMSLPLILGALFFLNTGLCLDFRSRHFYFKFKPLYKIKFAKFSSIISKHEGGPFLSYVEPVDSGGQSFPPVGSGPSGQFQHLSVSQNQQLSAVLSELHDVLTPKLGECTLGENSIELTDSVPVRRPPHRLSPPKVHFLRGKIQEMLDQGTIRPSTSDYSSPIFLVPKGENNFRPVIDYRLLNTKVKIESIPSPDVHSAFAWFGGARVFTSLDLNQAHYQIPLSEGS